MHKLKYLDGNTKKFLFDGCKLIFHQDRLKDFLDGKKIMPIHIDMGIHKGCNIKCIYCYGIKQKPSAKYIPEDRLMLLAEDARKCGIRSLAVIGDGEPTMNKGLYRFVQHCRGYGIDVSVATNGLLLDEVKVRMLTHTLTWLRFNVSAVGKMYDAIHGAPKNSFYKFEEVVKLAVKHRQLCTIGLQMVLIPQCFNQVIPLAKKAIEWGVDYLVIKQFSDGGEDMPIHFDMESYNRANDILKEAESLSNDNTSIIVKWSAIQDTKDITIDNKWGFNRCIDLPLLFQISGNGKCYPCGYLFGDERYCYGDVTTQRLYDILHSQRYYDVIEKVANTPLVQLCQGQCRHCETNKFIDRIKKLYTGNLKDALIKLCGSENNYIKVMTNPPQHINFI